MRRWTFLWLALIALFIALDASAVLRGGYGAPFSMHFWSLLGLGQDADPPLLLRRALLFSLWVALTIHLFTGRINLYSPSGR